MCHAVLLSGWSEIGRARDYLALHLLSGTCPLKVASTENFRPRLKGLKTWLGSRSCGSLHCWISKSTMDKGFAFLLPFQKGKHYHYLLAAQDQEEGMPLKGWGHRKGRFLLLLGPEAQPFVFITASLLSHSRPPVQTPSPSEPVKLNYPDDRLVSIDAGASPRR